MMLFDDPAALANSGAVLSACERYRYRLWRRWGCGPGVLWVLLNPSTADAIEPDPTLRRCVGFARAWGLHGVEIVNVYAFRTPSPAVLKMVRKRGFDVAGPENALHLNAAFAAHVSGTIVCGWGDNADPADAARVRAMMPTTAEVVCLGRNTSGSPRHPLYLAADTPREPWNTQR